MQKRASYILPPITGYIDHGEVTDRGMRYIGRDSEDNDVSVDIHGSGIDVNAGGRMVMIEGAYLEWDDNDRKYVVCDRKNGIFMNFRVADDGAFTLKYGREG